MADNLQTNEFGLVHLQAYKWDEYALNASKQNRILICII